MKTESHYSQFTLLTILGFFIFRIIFLATTHYDLIADEAYFWDWSRHPDWSYYDMGPMVALIIRIFTTILPMSDFSVRFGAPVLSALTAMVAYQLAREVLESKKLAFWFILIFHLTPIATAGGVIMTYYAPQVFFMSLTAYFLWRLIKSDNGFWWYPLGASLGLGVLSHHQFVVFSAEVVLFILLSSNHRKWLFRKEAYLGLLIELMVASPVFIWNLTHEAVMAKHAVGLMSVSPKFLKTFFEFLGGQAGVHTPLYFIAIIYALVVCGYRGIVKKSDTHLFLFCLSAPTILFIALLCMGGRTEANWPISGYITGGIAAVAVWSEKYAKGSEKLQMLVSASVVATLILGLVVLILISYPQVVYQVTGFRLPPDMDPANRLYGAKILGQEASKVLATMPKGSFVTTRDYGLNALLAFYMKGNPQVYQLPDGRRMSQYDFWNPYIKTIGRQALFVNTSPMAEHSKRLFDKVQLVKEVPIYVRGTNIQRKKFYLYKCYGYTAKPVEQFEHF
ncbi:MAG: glycosyltransferase family 39 protein [Desulfobacteraceae bacterium]|jgi:4-amino-4-deoxy-L-arabinose transferase-like glycosyltransferase